MKEIIDILKSKQMTIGLAESMTGGFLASRFVEFKGVSEVFKGSMVCYDERVKINVLKVDKETIDTYGVVSKEVAIEMSKKAKEMFQSDIGVSVTGYAESPSYAYISLYINKKSYHHFINYQGLERKKAIEKVLDEIMTLLHKVLLSL